MFALLRNWRCHVFLLPTDKQVVLFLLNKHTGVFCLFKPSIVLVYLKLIQLSLIFVQSY